MFIAMSAEQMKEHHSNYLSASKNGLRIGQPRLDGYMPVIWPNGRMARFALNTNVTQGGDEISGIVIVYPDHSKVSFELFGYRKHQVRSLVVETRCLEVEGQFPSVAKAGIDVVAILNCENSIERAQERCGGIHDLGQLKESAKKLASNIQDFIEP
jgi:hypothetical protein